MGLLRVNGFLKTVFLFPKYGFVWGKLGLVRLWFGKIWFFMVDQKKHVKPIGNLIKSRYLRISHRKFGKSPAGSLKFRVGNSRNLKFQAGNVGILFEIGKKHANKTTYSPATQVFRDLGDSIITYVLHYFEKRIIIPHQIPKGCHKQSLKSYIMPNTPKKRTFLFDKDQVFWQHA